MYCGKHNYLKSVEYCTACGEGICNECNNKIKKVLSLSEPLCLECAHKEIRNEQRPLEKEITSAKKQLIFTIVLCSIGAALIIYGILFAQILAIIAGVILCGFRAGYFVWKIQIEEQNENPETYVKYTARKTYDDKIEVKSETYEETNYLGILFGSIICALLGSVAFPFLIIYDICRIANCKKELKRIESSKFRPLISFEVDMDLKKRTEANNRGH